MSTKFDQTKYWEALDKDIQELENLIKDNPECEEYKEAYNDRMQMCD